MAYLISARLRDSPPLLVEEISIGRLNESYEIIVFRRMTSSNSSSSTWTRGPFNWLAGRRVEPMDSPGAFTNREPRSGQELCRVAASGPQDVDRAVAAARAAFPAWAALSG